MRHRQVRRENGSPAPEKELSPAFWQDDQGALYPEPGRQGGEPAAPLSFPEDDGLYPAWEPLRERFDDGEPLYPEEEELFSPAPAPERKRRADRKRNGRKNAPPPTAERARLQQLPLSPPMPMQAEAPSGGRIRRSRRREATCRGRKMTLRPAARRRGSA